MANVQINVRVDAAVKAAVDRYRRSHGMILGWATIPSAVLLTLAGCHDLAEPMAWGERNPWEMTQWGGLFGETREMGGRATITPSEVHREFEAHPTDPLPMLVLSWPMCSISGDPDAGDAARFLDCMDELADTDDKTNSILGSYYGFRMHRSRLLEWEADEERWHVWGLPTGFSCGNGYHNALDDGVTRRK